MQLSQRLTLISRDVAHTAEYIFFALQSSNIARSSIQQNVVYVTKVSAQRLAQPLWFFSVSINLFQSALITSSFKAYDLMRKDHGGKGGTIVNISSIVGLINPALLPVYGATKSAVLQFSTCLGVSIFNRLKKGARF